MYLYLALCGKVLVAEELCGRVGYRVGFWEKMPEASPMSNGANAGQIQDRYASGQGWAHQWQWKHLWDNRFKKVKNTCWTTAARTEELDYVRETGLQASRLVKESYSYRGRSRRDVWWTDHNLSLFTCAAVREEVEMLGIKLSPGKWDGCKGRFFLNVMLFLIPLLRYNFPRLCLFCLWW